MEVIPEGTIIACNHCGVHLYKTTHDMFMYSPINPETDVTPIPPMGKQRMFGYRSPCYNCGNDYHFGTLIAPILE